MAQKRFNFIITESLIGLRLDKALSMAEQIQSRSRAEFLIAQNLVWLNGAQAKPSRKILSTDVIEFEIPEASPQILQPFSLKLDIRFEDDDLLVVNKPAGLVVHPAAGHHNDTLVNALISHDRNFAMKFNESRPGIVHRLDKDTSGLLVVCKNDFAQDALVSQFKARSVHRIYQAVISARNLPPTGTVKSYLARHSSDRKKYASCRNTENQIIREPVDDFSEGKWAVTHYRVLKRSPSGAALLELKLETGRTHQIRVHLSEIGGPILGDPIYAGKSIQNLAPRLALHAKELGFIHPRTQADLKFEVNWPPEMDDFLNNTFGA